MVPSTGSATDVISSLETVLVVEGNREHQPHSSVMKLTIGVHEYNSTETVEYYHQRELMRI